MSCRVVLLCCPLAGSGYLSFGIVYIWVERCMCGGGDGEWADGRMDSWMDGWMARCCLSSHATCLNVALSTRWENKKTISTKMVAMRLLWTCDRCYL